MNISRLTKILFIILATTSVRAQDTGILVVGTGEAMARPTSVEIDLTASASAELTSDAVVKYQDALRRTVGAFEALKLKDLQIEQRGLSFTNSMSGIGPNQATLNTAARPGVAAKPQTDITRSLKLVLRNVKDLPEAELMETLSKLLDTAKDSGAVLSGSAGGMASNVPGRVVYYNGQPVVSTAINFVHENAEDVREQAYARAFAQAQARARNLAKLAGVELGPVLAVEEYADPSTTSSGVQRLVSDKLGDMPLRVTLRVRFAAKPESK